MGFLSLAPPREWVYSRGDYRLMRMLTMFSRAPVEGGWELVGDYGPGVAGVISFKIRARQARLQLFYPLGQKAPEDYPQEMRRGMGSFFLEQATMVVRVLERRRCGRAPLFFFEEVSCSPGLLALLAALGIPTDEDVEL